MMGMIYVEMKCVFNPCILPVRNNNQQGKSTFKYFIGNKMERGIKYNDRNKINRIGYVVCITVKQVDITDNGCHLMTMSCKYLCHADNDKRHRGHSYRPASAPGLAVTQPRVVIPSGLVELSHAHAPDAAPALLLTPCLCLLQLLLLTY